jgi:hypothetical protein
VRTADHRGKVLLIYLFAADDMEAARTLPALEAVARQFEEVQPIGVCISTDHGDGWVLSRAGGYSFPIGIEVTATRVSGSPSSAVASAYDVDILPTLAVTDRYSRVRRVATDSSYDVSDLTRMVQERLAE